MTTSSLKKSFVITPSSSFCAVLKPCYNDKSNLSHWSFYGGAKYGIHSSFKIDF